MSVHALQESMLCPICFENNCDIITKCNHQVCSHCMEQIISRKRMHVHNDEPDESIISCTPTFAWCPICRSMVDMFDLMKYSAGDSKAVEKAYPKQIGIGPLKGCTFELDKKLGLGSIHFTTEDDDCIDGGVNQNNSPPSDIRPYVSFENTEAKETLGCLDNGAGIPPRLYFSPGFHFHEKSNTFFGTIDLKDLSTTWYGSNKWEYVIQFSSNLMFACGGCIVMHRDEIENFSPFDGKWKQKIISPLSQIISPLSHETRIEVVAGSYAHFAFGYNHQLDFSKHENVSYLGQFKTLFGFDQITRNVSSMSSQNGPPVGCSISLTSYQPQHFQAVYTRESIISKNTTLKPKVIRFGFRDKSLRRYQHFAPTLREISSNSQTLWGNIFVQSDTIGLASYHFMAPDNEYGVFISYESSQTALWGNLDDGSPLPARVPFRDFEFDFSTMTFRGNIAWKDDYGTSWNGSIKWEYKMVFNENFRSIASGEIRNILEGNVEGITHYYGTDLFYTNLSQRPTHRPV